MFKSSSFKKYLDGTNNYSMSIIIRHFKFEDESDCICSIIEFINNEIIKLKYYDKQAVKCIFKAFKILNNPSNYKKIIDFKEIENQITILEDNIKIASIDSDNEMSKFFKIILDNVELLKKQLDFSSEVTNNKNLEDFAEKIIFETRNIDLCIELFKTFPDIINAKDENNKLLIEKILDKYICYLKNNDNYFLNYYDIVVNSLLINCHDNLDKNVRTIITQLLNHAKVNNNDTKIQLFLERVICNIADTYMFTNYEDVSKIYNIDLDEPEFFINPIISHKYDNEKDKCIITIDGKYTKIRDDAFSVSKLKNDNYLLEIYASNVSSYVLPETDLDKRARSMGKTIWTNLGQINMLPQSLSQNILSLNIDGYRRCICYSFEFTKELELVDFNIRRTLIKPSFNISYDEVDTISKDNIELYNSLSLARVFLELSNYNNTNINEYHSLKTIRRRILNVNNKNRDIDISNSGEKLINIFKLLLGNHVSKLVFNNGLPFIYRVNNASLDKNILALKERYTDTKDSTAILNIINSSLGKSYYSTKNLGHKGLGLDCYSNVSISIRNYVSLVCERLICKYFIDDDKLSDKDLVKIEKYLSNLVEEINLRMRLNDEYVLELNKIKKRT